MIKYLIQTLELTYFVHEAVDVKTMYTWMNDNGYAGCQFWVYADKNLALQNELVTIKPKSDVANALTLPISTDLQSQYDATLSTWNQIKDL